MAVEKDTQYSVLCLDDDPHALAQMRLYLQEHLDIVDPCFFGSPQQAISSHFERHFDIVISDLRLGTTNGLDVIAKMREFAPHTAYLLISGDADLHSAMLAMNEAKVIRFLTKPLHSEEVAAGLNDAVSFLNENRKLQEVSLTESALERMGMAIARFSHTLHLTYANDYAKTVLSDCASISLSRQGQLQSSGVPNSAELHSLIKASFISPQRQGWPVVCGQEENQIDLIFYPLIKDERDIGAQTYDLLLLDPAKGKEIDPAALAAALKISLSEARVVKQLAAGLTLEATADACNLSLSTVRTYLKNTYAKTGTSRQAELVSKALRSAP